MLPPPVLLNDVTSTVFVPSVLAGYLLTDTCLTPFNICLTAVFKESCCLLLTGVTVVGGLVYAVGGFNGSLRVRTVDVYDPGKDTWSSVASMEARRSTLGAAVLNGCIYAIGGFDGSSGIIT